VGVVGRRFASFALSWKNWIVDFAVWWRPRARGLPASYTVRATFRHFGGRTRVAVGGEGGGGVGDELGAQLSVGAALCLIWYIGHLWYCINPNTNTVFQVIIEQGGVNLPPIYCFKISGI